MLKGIEANIIDYDGTIDMPEDVVGKLDYVIASLHPPCIDFGTIEENTQAILKVMDNPEVKIIGHLDDSRYPVDYETMCRDFRFWAANLLKKKIRLCWHLFWNG